VEDTEVGVRIAWQRLQSSGEGRPGWNSSVYSVHLLPVLLLPTIERDSDTKNVNWVSFIYLQSTIQSFRFLPAWLH